MRFPLGSSEYRQVLAQYGLDHLPRMLGFPKQVIVLPEAEYRNNGSSHAADGMDILLRQMSMWDGRRPLFTSVNGWSDYHWDGHSFWPRMLRLGSIFVDLDCAEDRERALEECRLLDHWATEEGLAHVSAASGGKGFHFYLRLAPEERPYDEPLRRMVNLVSRWFKDTLHLSTMDMKCAEPRRLTRLPWSLHVRESETDESWVANGRRVLPLSSDDLQRMTMAEIDHRAETTLPAVGSFLTQGELPTLADLVDRLGISMPEVPERVREVPSAPIPEMPTGFWAQLIRQLEPRLCVQAAVFGNAPPHEMRVALATRLHQLQYIVPGTPIGDEAFWQDFFWQMEEELGWKDRFNHARRREQVHSIFGNDRYISSTGCGKLAIEYEACVGKQCPFYEEAKARHGFRVREEEEEKTL